VNVGKYYRLQPGILGQCVQFNIVNLWSVTNVYCLAVNLQLINVIIMCLFQIGVVFLYSHRGVLADCADFCAI